MVVNVVYRALAEPFAYATPDGKCMILWTSQPVKGAAYYAFFSGYSYCVDSDREELLRAPRALIISEPVVTQPREYDPDFARQFDRVFTMVQPLNGSLEGKARWYPNMVYEGYPGKPGARSVEDLRKRYPVEGRRRAAVMILGNKMSNVRGQLYDFRRSLAGWFAKSSVRLDVYGRPPFDDLPNYRGEVPDGKLEELLSQYRFVVELENVHDPFWSRGYLSDRAFRGLELGCFPFYLGCANIEDWVPVNKGGELGLFGDLRPGLENPEEVFCWIVDVMMDRPERWFLEDHRDRVDEWLRSGAREQFRARRLFGMLAEEAEYRGDVETWNVVEVPPVHYWLRYRWPHGWEDLKWTT